MPLDPRPLLRFVLRAPLNRRHPVRALCRAVWWQMASRLRRGPVTVAWVGGTRLRVHRGEVALTGNVYAGLQEFEDMAFLLHYLRADDGFCDVGANAGAYTVLASGVCGARTIALEPSPETHARLVANVALNALSPRVTCVASAAGATAGTLTLAGAAGPDAHAAVAGETGLPVPVMPLDALLQAQRVTLLKVDVEGMELPVLEGATALLADDALGAVIVELNGSGWRYGRSDDAVVARLTAAGFCAAAYDPFTRTLTPLPGANPHRGNTIFVRSFHDAAERVRRGPPVTVQGWVL